MTPLVVVFFFSFASLACRARANGVLGSSLAEAEAAEGLVGVLGLVGVGVAEVALCDSGALPVGVLGFLSTFTRAALASLSLEVEVGLGVSFILSPAAGALLGVVVAAVLAGVFCSG